VLFQLSPRSPPSRLKSSPQIKNSVYLAKSPLDEACHQSEPVEKLMSKEPDVSTTKSISFWRRQKHDIGARSRDEEQPRKTAGKVERL